MPGKNRWEALLLAARVRERINAQLHSIDVSEKALEIQKKKEKEKIDQERSKALDFLKQLERAENESPPNLEKITALDSVTFNLWHFKLISG